MGKLSAALNAIFSTSGDAGLTSSMKVPYFKSKTIDGNTAFYPDGMASMSALASVLGGIASIANASNGGLDNVKKSCTVRYSGDYFGEGCFGICECKVLDSVFAYQVAIDLSKDKIYFRIKYIKSQEWSWPAVWQVVSSTALT